MFDNQLQNRIDALTHLTQKQVVKILRKRNYHGFLKADEVQILCQEFNLTPVVLALNCLEIAACYSFAPVSNFYVGAIAIAKNGDFYFGANQEFSNCAINQTIHAEQSAIAHAWLKGATAITDIVVNYTPCGHCRQFINELNTSNTVKIHLPHSQNNLLKSYLPDSFGPKDLNIKKLLFDKQNHNFEIANSDELVKSALIALNKSYAPYSKNFNAVAIQAGNNIFTGQYAENAAFNPSLPALQSALNLYRLSNETTKITRIVMLEAKTEISHRALSTALAQNFLGVTLEYFEI